MEGNCRVSCETLLTTLTYSGSSLECSIVTGFRSGTIYDGQVREFRRYRHAELQMVCY